MCHKDVFRFVLIVHFCFDCSRSRPGGHRRGYMGHLTKIANHITQSTVKGNNVDRIKELLKGELNVYLKYK